MKVLAIMRPRSAEASRAEIMRHARAELQTLWSQYADGFVREMYSPGGPGAVLVVEAESAKDAASRLKMLPLLGEGVMTLETIELHPFSAIGMLFADHDRADER